jgi:hypothetical protein
MKVSQEYIGSTLITAISIFIFLTIKFWPSQILLAFDNFFIRFASIITLIVATYFGIIPGLFTLIALISIFYQRNQYKVASVQQMTGGGESHGDSTEALKMIDGDETAPKSAHIVVPDNEDPNYNTIDYLPKNSQQSNEFTGTGRQFNQTVPLGTAAGAVWQQAARQF